MHSACGHCQTPAAVTYAVWRRNGETCEGVILPESFRWSISLYLLYSLWSARDLRGSLSDRLSRWWTHHRLENRGRRSVITAVTLRYGRVSVPHALSESDVIVRGIFPVSGARRLDGEVSIQSLDRRDPKLFAYQRMVRLPRRSRSRCGTPLSPSAKPLPRAPFRLLSAARRLPSRYLRTQAKVRSQNYQDRPCPSLFQGPKAL